MVRDIWEGREVGEDIGAEKEVGREGYRWSEGGRWRGREVGGE